MFMKDIKRVRDDLSPFTESVVKELERNMKLAAVHTYRCTLRSFARFSGGADAPLPMAEVFTPQRLKAYEAWLLWQGRSPNTLSTYLRTLHAVYNRWMPPGTPGHNPKLFDGLHLRVVSRTKRALTPPQMGGLISAGLSQALPQGHPQAPSRPTDKQQAALSYFLLMFMLNGMPFIDLAHLRKSDYSAPDATISYSRHKTGKPMLVDIPPEAMPLLLKCRDKTDSPYLFPLLDAHIRDAAQLYRNYRRVLRHFNRTLAVLARQLLPGVKLSSYTARHTWATLAYHQGVSPGIISQALGHSSIQVTMTYLKPFKSKEIDKINRQIIAEAKRSRPEGRRTVNALNGM